MSSGNGKGVLAGFKADYERIFVKEWSPFAGVIMLLLAIISLMVSGQVWAVFGGVRFWGDWINNLIGLGPALGIPRELEEGDLYHTTKVYHPSWGFSTRKERALWTIQSLCQYTTVKKH
mgnify:CR=1 FL=1